MSTTTKNFGLLKPELTDSADITAYNGNWDKIDEELLNVTKVVTTGGTSSAYTATVDTIKQLTPGVSLVIIPHVENSWQFPTLNVNSLGAKIMRLYDTGDTGTIVSIPVSYLKVGKPVRVMYDGEGWIVDRATPNMNNVCGVLPVAHGGTGGTTASEARELLGVPSQIAFAKLSAQFTSHKDGDNPHQITCEKIGAAKSTHNHDASDINVGTLSTDRLPVLPIEKGGTGATTATNARKAIGAASENVMNILIESLGEHLDDSSNPHGITCEKIGASPTGHNHYYDGIVTTAGTSSAYTANVPGITELRNGISFTIIPHVNNTVGTPTLNVNSLGAKEIWREMIDMANGKSTLNYDTGNVTGSSTLQKDFPLRVTYFNNNWYVDRPASLVKPYSYGTSDLTPGSSTLKTGTLYFVYE